MLRICQHAITGKKTWLYIIHTVDAFHENSMKHKYTIVMCTAVLRVKRCPLNSICTQKLFKYTNRINKRKKFTFFPTPSSPQKLFVFVLLLLLKLLNSESFNAFLFFIGMNQFRIWTMQQYWTLQFVTTQSWCSSRYIRNWNANSSCSFSIS